ncbi:MAG: hypothetical protein K2K45_02110 [Muribaculaceae bacterium]|nr:hypothetical protein [Muribaculaceae bacterium]
MEENFATRLKLFMDSIHVPSTQFADMCEIPRPSFSQLLSGRNQKVSDVLIRKIHAAYPDLSVMWLMFGEGPMLSRNNSNGRSSELFRDEEIENASEIPEKINDGTETSEFSNVKGLTKAKEQAESNLYQQLENNKKILEMQLQIEKMQKNPRRVAQITVYYDDSTFETFVPSK